MSSATQEGRGDRPSVFDAVLERNRAFVLGRAPRALPPSGADVAVIACYDPRLSDFLLPALGLDASSVALIRLPGALLRPDSDAMRALAVAAFLLGVREVLVVGHTGCRMAGFESAPFIEAFRRRGVAREAFGDGDLRTWAGAIASPSRGVLATIAAIGAAPFLPRDLIVGGLVIHDETGALEVVLRPGDAVPGSVAAPADEAAAEMATRLRSGPELAAEPEGGAGGPAALAPDPLLGAARSALRAAGVTRELGDELLRLRLDLRRTDGSRARLALIERFLGRAAGQSKEMAAALRRLKQEGAGAGGRAGAGGIVDLFRRALEEDAP